MGIVFPAYNYDELNVSKIGYARLDFRNGPTVGPHEAGKWTQEEHLDTSKARR